MEQSTRVGLRFCPMEYIRVMSKQLARALNGCSLEKELRRPVLGKTVLETSQKLRLFHEMGAVKADQLVK